MVEILGFSAKRAVKLMQLISDNPGLNITELSQKAELDHSKVSVYTKAFVENGWIIKQADDKKRHLYFNNAGKIALRQLKGLLKIPGVNQLIKRL